MLTIDFQSKSTNALVYIFLVLFNQLWQLKKMITTTPKAKPKAKAKPKPKPKSKSKSNAESAAVTNNVGESGGGGGDSVVIADSKRIHNLEIPLPVNFPQSMIATLTGKPFAGFDSILPSNKKNETRVNFRKYVECLLKPPEAEEANPTGVGAGVVAAAEQLTNISNVVVPPAETLIAVATSSASPSSGVVEEKEEEEASAATAPPPTTTPLSPPPRSAPSSSSMYQKSSKARSGRRPKRSNDDVPLITTQKPSPRSAQANTTPRMTSIMEQLRQYSQTRPS